MSNLVIVEHDNNEVALATLNAVTAAQQIGGDIDLLIAELLNTQGSLTFMWSDQFESYEGLLLLGVIWASAGN